MVYVIGHQNPDTDSVCSAIAYAAFRRATDLPGATPARLGPLWAETAYALDRCGVPSPPLLGDVRQRVADVMNPYVRTLDQEATLYDAASVMRASGVRLLPIVDERRRLRGVITVDDVAARYLDDMALAPAHTVPVALDRYLRVLGGELLVGEPERRMPGRIWIGALSTVALRARVGSGDVVIVGDRAGAQEAALLAGAACLIVVGEEPVPDATLALARARDAVVLRSPHDSYATARLLNLSLPVAEVMRPPSATLDPDDLASEVAPALLNAGARALPVVDEDRHVVGIVSRSDLLRGRRKRVILVDHNQRGQAVEGLEEAELLAVIDHHNLGDLQTAEPIPFILEPVGCTATIVSELYDRAGLTPDAPIAGLLLAAIVSDTLLLTSPTTTSRDRAAVDRLAARSGFDAEAFARDLFRARSDFSATTPRDLVTGNLKTYEFGGATLAIGQVEALDTGYFITRRADFLGELERLKAEGAAYAIFLATDILHHRSTALYPGAAERRLLASAFNRPDAGPNSVELPGIVSRKKQVVPPLARALG